MDGFGSPIIASSGFFIDPPLSTKRERQQHPARIASVPRAARTAPARSRFVHHRFKLQRPHLVSFRPGSEEKALNSSCYNAEYEATYFDQVFQYIKKLGEGSFGEVIHVLSREDQRAYAVKRVVDPFRSESDRKAKLREVQKHELIPANKNILEYYKAWEEKGRLYIQIELCKQSLGEYSQNYHPVPEGEVWNYFLDIIQAVNHLHNHNLLHMDIKPENILMTKDKVCKLGDFGRVFDLNNDNKDIAEEGDSKYLAKEVLNNAPTKAADVFSVGMTILEIATDMELPSQGESWHQVRKGEIPERFFTDVSYELRGYIMQMIHADPNLRPPTNQLLKILTNKVPSRNKHISVHEVKKKMADVINFIFIHFIFIIFAVLRELFGSKLSRLYSSSRFSSNQAIPRTPIAVRTPIAQFDPDLDYNYSDEGSLLSHSFQHSHSSSLSVSGYPENPCPRYKLNFDDDSTTSGDSTPLRSNMWIREGTPPCASPSIMTRNTSRGSQMCGSSGDWDTCGINDESDSDGEMLFKRGIMTAPPRFPASRTAYRFREGKKAPPKLNLHLLDSPQESQQEKSEQASPMVAQGDTPKSRATRNLQNRLISNEHSADEM